MKATTLFLICLVAFAAADQAKMDTLLQMKASAGDAMDTVMQVLNDLKQSALDERSELDIHHDIKEDYFALQINELTAIRNTNRNIYDDAIANREYVEAEIEDTQNYLVWITNRYASISQLILDLQDDRCEASLIFVTRLREHYEALDAIALLRQDLKTWESAGMPTLTEIKELKSFNRLSAFTHLFKKNALQSFLSLTDDGDLDYLEETSVATAEEIGTDHQDNDKAQLELETFDSGMDERAAGGSVVDRVMTRLDVFEKHLNESMQDLIQNEIRAGRDTVRYIQQAEQETFQLQREEERRIIYLAKLENDLVLAISYEEKCEQTWNDSVTTLEQMVADRDANRAFYMVECDRLANDVLVVDEVIKIFLQELAGIDEIIRTQVVDYFEDERFDKGAFGRTEQNFDNYQGGGGIQAVVKAEAAAMML